MLNFKRIKIEDHALISYFSNEFADVTNRELIEKKVCSIMDKAKGSFQFILGTKENFGLRVNIPKNEKDSVEYSKNYLKNLM